MTGDPGMPVISVEGSQTSEGSAQYETGLIEVWLNDNVVPTIDGLTLNSSNADLGALNKAIEALQAQEVFCCFRDIDALASDADDSALSPDPRNLVTIRLRDDADVLAAAKQLREIDDVKYAMPVPLVAPASGPTAPPPPMVGDPLTGTSDKLVTNRVGLTNQWYVFRTKLDQAWLKHDGNGVVLVDIDMGFRTTHQDLNQNIDLNHAFNSFDGSGDVTQGTATAHGTGVLGLAAAKMNNVGMCGAAPNVEVWPIQYYTGGTPLRGNPIANGILWALRKRTSDQPMVILLPLQTRALGFIEQMLSVNAAIMIAIMKGAIVVVGAGNGNRDIAIADDNVTSIPQTPSIKVGSTDYNASGNPRSASSNFGSLMTLSAPGDEHNDVTCAPVRDDAYTNVFGGTSGASALVAGTVALMLGVNPKLKQQQVRDILFTNSDVVDTDVSKPVGSFLNAANAVDQARSTP